MIEVKSETEMQQFGEKFGHIFTGGEVIELVGDVGAGKTTFVRGLARGMGIDEPIQSPSFTINRVYDASNGLRLVHYDFYRLADPGIMRDELSETINDPQAVVIIEWADSVERTLPIDHLTISITSPSENGRKLYLAAGGDFSQSLIEKVT